MTSIPPGAGGWPDGLARIAHRRSSGRDAVPVRNGRSPGPVTAAYAALACGGIMLRTGIHARLLDHPHLARRNDPLALAAALRMCRVFPRARPLSPPSRHDWTAYPAPDGHGQLSAAAVRAATDGIHPPQGADGIFAPFAKRSFRIPTYRGDLLSASRAGSLPFGSTTESRRAPCRSNSFTV